MVSIAEKIKSDLKQAMLDRDSLAVDTLRGLRAAILLQEVSDGVRETGLGDEKIEQVVAKEIKKRYEAAEMFKIGGKPDMSEKELSEAEILKRFLPKQLTIDELRAIVLDQITKIQPSGPKDMGKVISAVRALVGNSADSSDIAKLVKDNI